RVEVEAAGRGRITRTEPVVVLRRGIDEPAVAGRCSVDGDTSRGGPAVLPEGDDFGGTQGGSWQVRHDQLERQRYRLAQDKRPFAEGGIDQAPPRRDDERRHISGRLRPSRKDGAGSQRRAKRRPRARLPRQVLRSEERRVGKECGAGGRRGSRI